MSRRSSMIRLVPEPDDFTEDMNTILDEYRPDMTGNRPEDDLMLSLICPNCGGKLVGSRDGESSGCRKCSEIFVRESGVPLLYWPASSSTNQDVTETVKSFYEETPFPNYEHLDSAWKLREKASKGLFARLLDEQIPHGSNVLEVGCGTGQLTNYLGMTWGRKVYGTDISLSSLTLGQRFKQKFEIPGAVFLQMNLFRPVFLPESFDLIVCNGVLHHTANPQLGLVRLAGLLKIGGHVIVGLYNKFGRIPTNVKQAIFNLSGNRFLWLDPNLRSDGFGGARKRAWFQDQYKHPHESKHSIDEVMNWFEDSGLEFVNSIPKSIPFSSFTTDERLFERNEPGSRLEHLLVELGIALSGGREGGFFLMIGRKKGNAYHR